VPNLLHLRHWIDPNPPNRQLWTQLKKICHATAIASDPDSPNRSRSAKGLAIHERNQAYDII